MRTILTFLAAAILFTGPIAPAAKADTSRTITVKLLVDQKEPRLRSVWEKEYRDRFAAASAVFRQACGIQFKVVAVSTWNSDESLHDFNDLAKDFAQKVQPAPAQLAVGFTGQYFGLKGDKRVGGAFGPFCSHILIREWGRQITEPEREEILIHELGHHLGAVHSSERSSVMRPDLSQRDKQSRSSHPSFDASNAKIMKLVAEDRAKHPVRELCDLSPATKRQLADLYKSLGVALPHDPAAPIYLKLLSVSQGGAGGSSAPKKSPLPAYRTELSGNRQVLVRNPNDFGVLLGVRSGKVAKGFAAGKDLVVPPRGSASCYLPDGRYQVFFVYSHAPTSVTQAAGLNVSGKGMEMRIDPVGGRPRPASH